MNLHSNERLDAVLALGSFFAMMTLFVTGTVDALGGSAAAANEFALAMLCGVALAWTVSDAGAEDLSR